MLVVAAVVVVVVVVVVAVLFATVLSMKEVKEKVVLFTAGRRQLTGSCRFYCEGS